MKYAILILGLSFGNLAFGADVITTVDCATTNGKFTGSKTLNIKTTDFTADQFKDILLGQRQVEHANTPYPSDIVVAPSINDLQDVKVVATSPFMFVKAVYFTLQSKNFVDMFTFCTVSQERGL